MFFSNLSHILYVFFLFLLLGCWSGQLGRYYALHGVQSGYFFCFFPLQCEYIIDLKNSQNLPSCSSVYLSAPGQNLLVTVFLPKEISVFMQSSIRFNLWWFFIFMFVRPWTFLYLVWTGKLIPQMYYHLAFASKEIFSNK